MALLLVAVATGVELLRIRNDIESGRSTLSNLSLAAINANGGLAATVDQAADHLDRADHRARTSVVLKLLAPVPIVGNQVRAVRDLAAATNAIGVSGREAANAIQADLDRAGGKPAARIELLDTVLVQLAKVQARVRTIDPGAHGWLVPPVANARSRLVGELASAPDRLEKGRRYTTALRRLLNGPGNYLILAANNAEMRAGAGMPLAAGTVHIEGGDIDSTDFRKTGDTFIVKPDAQAIPVPFDLRSTYPRFGIGRDFRETAASPDFPVTGAIYADMARQLPFGPVEGVFSVDAIALRALISAIGPVELDGRTYTEKNIEAEVLYKNYLRFSTEDLRDERADLQSRLAVAIFDALKTRDVPVTKLAVALSSAAKGRHLLAWSRDPDLEKMWGELGADGRLDRNGLMVCVENTAANKLDYHLAPKVRVDVQPVGEALKATISVTIKNPVVDPTGVQVDGTLVRPPKAHRVLVAIYLPLSAYDVRSIEEPFTETGVDGPMKLVGMRYIIEKGKTRTVTIEFYLPPTQKGALLLPSGRARPLDFVVNGTPVTDAVPTPISWSH